MDAAIEYMLYQEQGLRERRTVSGWYEELGCAKMMDGYELGWAMVVVQKWRANTRVDHSELSNAR